MHVILYAHNMTERKIAQEYLKMMLSLPEYYGENLDALADCLGEMGETEITVVLDTGKPEGYLGRICQVLCNAVEENTYLTVRFEE